MFACPWLLKIFPAPTQSANFVQVYTIKLSSLAEIELLSVIRRVTSSQLSEDVRSMMGGSFSSQRTLASFGDEPGC